MVAMQMAYKNMVYFVNGYFIASQLKLTPFSTVNQEVFILDNQILGGWKPSVDRNCSTCT